MDPRLHVAACNGDVGALQELLQEDPLVLSKAIMSTSSDSPLHIAALLGHTNFAKLVMSLNPELSRDLNQQGYTPIHLASLKGHLQIVTELLNFDKGLCFVKDSEGRTPLHCAAIKGRVEVITHLMRCCPESAMGVTDKGESLLHLVVNNGQKEALVLLISSLRELNLLHKLIDDVNDDGKTALQLAIARNQNQMTKMLAIETENGDEITDDETNKQAVIDIVKNQNQMTETLSRETQNDPQTTADNETNKQAKKVDDGLKTLRNAIIVLCSLLATCCFQAIITPPGGVWQTRPSNEVILKENIKNISAFERFFLNDNTTLTDLLAPNKAMSMALQPRVYLQFLLADAMCFIASMVTIYLVTVAVLSEKKKKYWIAIFVMLQIVGVSATFLFFCIIALTSNASTSVSRTWLVIYFVTLAIIFAPRLYKYCLRPISSGLASSYSRLRVHISNRCEKMIAKVFLTQHVTK